ncbi:hypothetical protein EUBVEN_01826 [Eubacterium ventriosum ATCC 27560]|uniref:Uncharacterized protein n=1 Tax=Eubacterium ventriosum ATCC 27560 TaxID=411463 RepID=A5Z7Y7_9FIRM|nr:hypothetical protein EUBVEN_01826 [Eubacterium ventriosum ATCC 27560]
MKINLSFFHFNFYSFPFCFGPVCPLHFSFPDSLRCVVGSNLWFISITKCSNKIHLVFAIGCNHSSLTITKPCFGYIIFYFSIKSYPCSTFFRISIFIVYF